MRALLVVCPAPGVVNHCIKLCGLLKKAGLETTLLTGTQFGTDHALGGFAESLELSGLYDIDFTQPSSYFDQTCSEPFLELTTKDILRRLAQTKYDLLLGKYLISHLIVGKRLNIPHGYFYSDGPLFLSNKHTPQNNVAEHIKTLRSIEPFLCANNVPGPYHSLEEFIQSGTINVVRGTPLTTGYSEKSLHSLSANAVYCGSLLDGEFVADGPKRNSCQKKQILVTFGTMCTDTKFISALLNALPSSASIHLAVPPSVSLREQLVLPSNVVQIRVPNLMSHMKDSDLLVHHGGHGVTLEGLMCGIPQLIIPHNYHTAQAHHGRQIHDLGVGKLLNYHEAVNAPAVLRTACRDLLTVPFQRKARALAIKVKEESAYCGAHFISGVREIIGGSLSQSLETSI